MWLELNKTIRRAEFNRSAGRIEIPAVLEGQERSHSLLQSCLLAGRHDQRHLLAFTHRWAALTLFNKGSDQRTITIIVRKIICFLCPPRRVMSDKTPQFISKEFVANMKLNSDI